MSVKFKVKMTEDYMYDFMLYHNYTHLSGLLGGVIGVFAVAMAIYSFINGDAQKGGLAIIIALMFLIVTPRTAQFVVIRGR